MATVRASAARCVFAVCETGRSLGEVLPDALADTPDRDKGLLQALCYQTLRHGYSLRSAALGALKKPPRKKERIIIYLIMVGLCQIRHLGVADHAAVNSTVDATGLLSRQWARGLVNAVLRRELREPLPATTGNREEILWEHPAWLIHELRKAWPDHWQSILEANQTPGPMTLRVNVNHTTREAYRQELASYGIESVPTDHSAVGLVLDTPAPVHALPGFAEGRASVQDESGQMVVAWLDPQPGESVLDACSAPGSKTGHLLEWQNGDLSLTGVDQHPGRLERVRESLQRLGYDAVLLAGDAADPATYRTSGDFDRILLDVPCSGTGVIRRHPDIKWLRSTADIARLNRIQDDILRTAWTLLRPGGRLLYSTCSVLPAENELRVSRFLDAQADARSIALPVPDRSARVRLTTGEQWFPLAGGGDGFYYALLEKTGTAPGR